mmetsp:Transcript_33588/g.86007  ORF Transcript_33588/g.86007 Transcript_33588/m.86007 type:complete len:83 (-) Transcript_33588:887-1135(-)
MASVRSLLSKRPYRTYSSYSSLSLFDAFSPMPLTALRVVFEAVLSETLAVFVFSPLLVYLYCTLSSFPNVGSIVSQLPFSFI